MERKRQRRSAPARPGGGRVGTDKLAKENEGVTDESDMERDRDSENATDSEKQFDGGEFVPYIRKGVQRFRKKRGTGATVTQNRACPQHSVSSTKKEKGQQTISAIFCISNKKTMTFSQYPKLLLKIHIILI